MTRLTVSPSRIAAALDLKERTVYNWRRQRPKLYAALVEWYRTHYIPAKIKGKVTPVTGDEA